MASTFEKRLDRIESALGGSDESRILYCATDRDAERAWSEAMAAGRACPLCIVTGTSGPAVLEGETIGEMLAHVAVHGRRIHDPRPDAYTHDASHLWRPPLGQAQRETR